MKINNTNLTYHRNTKKLPDVLPTSSSIAVCIVNHIWHIFHLMVVI